jgi:DUF4097 and DUF4098 domain-containing protein YvlB
MRTLVVLFVVLLSGSTVFAGQSVDFSRRVAAGSKDRVWISNMSGSVRIVAWDRPEVDVQGRLGRGVKQVDVTRRGDSVDIRVVVDESWERGRDSSAYLDIRVPASSEVETNTISASTTVEGVRGRLRLKSVSGSIRTSDQGSDMEAKTVSGSIEVNGSGKSGRLQVASISGGIRIEQVAGDIEARSTSGSLRIVAQTVDRVQLHTVSGAISLRARVEKGSDVEVEAVSGSMNVTAFGDAGYTYDVSTYSGGIRSCFADGDLRRRSRGSGSELNGTRGDGGADLRLRAMSGSVMLCDR